ncbi:MAG: LTA synthase family protein [Oscillospiraceae bacterium]|nr:LTA synthase family protein [Oscillospiraceae bacterium]
MRPLAADGIGGVVFMRISNTVKSSAAEGLRAMFAQHGLLCNAVLLLLSALGTTVLSLALAIGTYDVHQFYGYFTNPFILLLNFIPVLLLQFLLVLVLKRQGAAFFLSSALVLLPSVGNFFKIKFRFEPFTFSDMASIAAGLSVAENYQISLNSRILAALLYIVAGSFAFALLARLGLKPGFTAKGRATAGIVTLGLCLPLWFGVYSNERMYMDNAYSNAYIGELTAQHNFIANGFVYPFIYSISQSKDAEPEGYSEETAIELLSKFSDEDIPEERKVNIFALQLESFTDLSQMGFSCVDEAAYAGLRQLEKESISGVLVPNVIGGGTINTERSFLTGNFGFLSYNKACNSYVRYFNDQGYITTGGHPNKPDFYNRVNVAEYLGFSEYLFEDYYNAFTGGRWNCDAQFLPESFRLFRERCSTGEKVFAFNISLQGHGPYSIEDCNTKDRYCLDSSLSPSSQDSLNAYLSLVSETQSILLQELDKLRNENYPAVVLVYGDHNPLFTDNAVYTEAGVSFDMSSEKGFMDYYSTPYMIWANETAKELLGHDFTGKGPVISPGYLMGVLFEQLGWKGSAYMQFTGAMREKLPVIHQNEYYIDGDSFSLQLSEQGETALRDYEYVQYYCKEYKRK